MADRKDFYYRQLVTEAELDAGFTDLEQADQLFASDTWHFGIMDGLTVAEAAVPDLTIDCAAGTAYDQTGQRIHVPSVQSVDLSADHLAVSTAVTNPGNSRIISLFAKFARVLSDPRLDGNGLTVYHDRAESFDWYIVQGAEAPTGTETPPALESDAVLIVDVTLDFGQTAILTADLDMLDRRQDQFVSEVTTHALRTGSPVVAVDTIWTTLGTHLDAYATHVAALLAATGAAMVGYAGGGAWYDGTTNPATSVELQLDKVISDLGGTSGAARLGWGGYSAIVGAPTRTKAACSIASGLSWLMDNHLQKLVTTGPDASQDIDESYDVYLAPTLTANRSWTLDTTSAPTDGRTIMVARNTTDFFSLTIVSDGGTTIDAFPPGCRGYGVYMAVSGAWIKIGGQYTAPHMSTIFIPCIKHPGSSANWSNDISGPVQDDNASAHNLYLSCPTPWGGFPIEYAPLRLVGYQVWLHGNGGGTSHTALPATMPVVKLYGHTLSNGTYAELSSTTDASASYTAYDAPHAVGVWDVGTPLAWVQDHVFQIHVSGETGANSKSSALQVLGVQLQVTQP